MAAEPRLWLGLRRLDALGLGLCALFLSTAAAAAAVLPSATDPSAVDGALAWQQPDGPGMLKAASARPTVLPGLLPALGGSRIAWVSGGQILVARRATLTVSLGIPVAGVSALAVSDGWLVFRDEAQGVENLVAVSLTSPQRRYLIGSRLPGVIGRPALDGSTVVFAIDTRVHASIESVDLRTGARRTLRFASQGALLASPSLLHGRLLYERLDRCAQQLRIGTASSEQGERVLLRLPSSVVRDPGFQPGYEQAWNGASLCPNRGSGPGSRTVLGPTSLTASTAYVTEISSDGASARILTLGD